MIAALRDILDQLGAAYRHGGSLVLLFDYDGTLTPIVAHPRLAVLDNDTQRLLTRLACRPRVSLGILSGRPLAELEALVRLPGLYLAGTGGMELNLRGTRVEHPQADQAAALMEQLAARLEKDVAWHPGAWLERKRFGVTVHYRHLPEHLVVPLRADVEAATHNIAGELRMVQGPRAWEIVPAWGWNKGTAARRILAHVGAGSDAVLYSGDGANDAEAMEEVLALGGIVLGIGPQAPSTAQYRLPNHVTLRTFLYSLDACLEKAKAGPVRSVEECLALHGLWKSILPTNPM